MGIKERQFSTFFYNRFTYAGVFLAVLTFLLEVFLFAVDLTAHRSNPYLGLLTYILLPPFLILGLVLIPLGALWKKRRIEKGLAKPEIRTLFIDPSIPQHRHAILVFTIGTFILIAMSLAGAYKAFHYTESVEFCGVLCHDVMRPEFTTYLKSPHARVKCVECHIGAGADWYMRSKLAGARQVLKAWTHTYEKPVKTPVRDLRPAAETCERCHWPGKFFQTLDFKRDYFLTEGESPWRLRMLLKVGGMLPENEGMHSHMSSDHTIYYVADDKERRKISWVKSVDREGHETVFTLPGSTYENQPPPANLIRKMDCIDCHNRPAHRFLPPYALVNEALKNGMLDASLPDIKSRSVELLAKERASGKEAREAIPKEFERFYRDKHPGIYQNSKDKIEQSGVELARIYAQNMFPDMKTRWDTHPDNIGHLVTPGCFRCHDGEHKSSAGKTITKDCNACHLIVEQGTKENLEKNLEGLEFKHPDGSEDWKDASCTDCHTGDV